MGRRPQWGGRCAPHRAGRPHRRGGILSSVHPGGGEVCAVAGAISPAAFCPHRPGAAGGASLPYTMQCGRRGGAVARIAPGRVQSPRGGLSSASGRRDAVQIGGDFPGGGRHRTAHGKRPGKIAPRKTGNKKRGKRGAGRVYLFFRVKFSGGWNHPPPVLLSSTLGGWNPSRSMRAAQASIIYRCMLCPASAAAARIFAPSSFVGRIVMLSCRRLYAIFALFWAAEVGILSPPFFEYITPRSKRQRIHFSQFSTSTFVHSSKLYVDVLTTGKRRRIMQSQQRKHRKTERMLHYGR